MLNLDFRDSRPIYEQVKDGLPEADGIRSHSGGRKAPSVRTMASSLAINPNTIQRAYDALESEGYLCSCQAKALCRPQQRGGHRAAGRPVPDL